MSTVENRLPVEESAPILTATALTRLYGERVGSLSFVCDDANIAQNVLGQLKATVRRIYSSPAANGALLVSQVLNDTALSQLWQSELEEMRQRI